MFFSSRKRKAALEAAELDGQSFWTDRFAEPARVKIHHAIVDSVGDGNWYLVVKARELVLRDEGLHTLTGSRRSEPDDFLLAVAQWEDSRIPTLIEAMSVVLDPRFNAGGVPFGALQRFSTRINGVLEEHRIAFELVDHRMVEFDSKELHAAVVQPALCLLGGSAEFVAIESSYQDALREISEHHYADAVTDAARALQETLRAVGCEGNALGRLLDSAVSKNLIVARDKKLVDWVSAERSQVGDAHVMTAPSKSDAWLSVHIVGALIVHLLSGESRRD